jgi:hypothetical protein
MTPGEKRCPRRTQNDRRRQRHILRCALWFPPAHRTLDRHLPRGCQCQGRLLRESVVSCVRQGRHRHCLSLLQRGADVNVLDKSGRSPLHRATEGGRIDIVQIVTQHNADVNLQNSDGDSALVLASFKGEMEISRLLLQRGADVNFQNQRGFLRYTGRHKMDIWMSLGTCLKVVLT